MTEEELRKLAQEFQEGLDMVKEIRKETNQKYDNLNKDEFFEEFSEQLDNISEDLKSNSINIKYLPNNDNEL